MFRCFVNSRFLPQGLHEEFPVKKHSRRRKSCLCSLWHYWRCRKEPWSGCVSVCFCWGLFWKGLGCLCLVYSSWQWSGQGGYSHSSGWFWS